MLLGEKEESCGMLAGKECSLTSYFMYLKKNSHPLNILVMVVMY